MSTPRANLLGPGTAHSCVIAEVAPSALFAHPNMAFYCDERTTRWLDPFRQVEHKINTAFSASPIPLDRSVVLHGSATFSKFQHDIPDLDIHARLRYRLDARPASLAGAQRTVIDAYAPAFLALIDSVLAEPGWGFIRLRTEWNSSVIDQRRFPQTLEVNWSAEDLAIGSTLTAQGEIPLLDALMCSSANKLTFFLPGASAAEPQLVDLQLDRGWTAPGGDCDLNPEPTNQWFAKVTATRDSAERAVAFERELADRFPRAYRVPGVYVEPMGESLVRRISRGELFKLTRLFLLGWSYLGRRDMAERTIELASAHRAELTTHFGVLGSSMQIARRHERPAPELAEWTRSRLRSTTEALDHCPPDTRNAIAPALDPLTAPSAPDPTDPRYWALINELLRAIRDRLNEEVLTDLRATPELLEVFPGARQALAIP